MAQMMAATVSALLVLITNLVVHASPASAKVVIAYVSQGVRVAPIWIAQEQGFFSKYGIQSELVWIKAAPLSITALHTGDAQVAYTAGSSPLGAALDKDDLRIVAGLFNKADLDLVARPEIKAPEDLRGKRVGVVSIGGGNWMQALLGLEHLGINSQRGDVQVVVSGVQSILNQALETGVIDAAVVNTAFSHRLREKGFTILLALSKANIALQALGLVVKKSFILEQPDVLEAILKGVIEALAFSVAPRNRATVVGILQKILRTSDSAALEEGYQDLLRTVERKPYTSLEGMRNIQRLVKTYNPRVEKAKVEDLIDNRVLRRLDETGFIDRLYRTYGVK